MDRKVFLVVFGVIAFLLLVYGYSLHCKAEISGSCPVAEKARGVADSLPIIAGVGILLGMSIYYVLDKKREEETIKGKEVATIVMKFLNGGEKKILSYLIENEGKCYQSELSRIEGVGKLRAHRTIKKLHKLGVVELTKMGKTNLVKLDESLKHFLIEKS